MYLTKSTILLLSNDSPVYKGLILGFSALLLVALVFLLMHKLKTLRGDFDGNNENVDADDDIKFDPLAFLKRDKQNRFADNKFAPVKIEDVTTSRSKFTSDEPRPTIIFETTLQPEKPADSFSYPPPAKTYVDATPKQQERPVQFSEANFSSPNVTTPPLVAEPVSNIPKVEIQPPVDQPKTVIENLPPQMPNVVLPPPQEKPVTFVAPPAASAPEPVKEEDNNKLIDFVPAYNETPVAKPFTNGNGSHKPANNDNHSAKPVNGGNGAHNNNGHQQIEQANLQTQPPVFPNIQPAATITIPTKPKTYTDSAFNARPLNITPPKNEAADREAIDAILNSLTDIIFEFDERKVCLNVWYNKTRALLVDLDTFKGRTVSESIGEEKAAELERALDEAIKTRESVAVEFKSFFGSGRWFSAKVSPVFDAHGDYTGRMTASVTDISEQKKIANALKENQHQLIEAQRVAKMGNWWYDLELKQTYWSDNLFSLLEIDSLPAATSHFEYYARLVNAEDRRSIYQFFADMTEMATREVEHRIVTNKGKQRHFLIIRGEPIRNRQGKIVRLTGIIKDVTESRLSERALKKSRAELMEAQTIAKIGNWKWYFNQKTLTWSDEVYHIHEVEPRAQKAHGISNFKLLLTYVHPDDKGILNAFLKDPANLKRANYEYRIITPNQNLKYLSIIIGKIRRYEDGNIRSVIGTLQDITDRKQAENIVQQTEDSYQTVLESIKLAAITLDKDGTIIFCNKFLANLLGYTQSSLVGQNWYRHFIPENLKNVFKGWYETDTIKATFVNPIICRNGEQRIIAWQNTTIYDDLGRIKQTTSIGEDVTDLQKDREKLINDKETAQKESLFKSDFLSTMSHEIRTPMNAVIGTANLLIEENPRPDQLPYLKNLKFSGETLLGIINDILDYNKIEAGKFSLHMVPVDLHDLMDNIWQSFRIRAREKNLQLSVTVDKTIPAIIQADPVRLGQIMNNLIGNAVKFTNKGSVSVQVKEQARNSNTIVLQFIITDTGAGITKENLEKVFEPYVQEMHVDQNGGSGLGLAIVKSLIELHGSRINISSTIGEGTQFSFAISYAYENEAPSKRVIHQPMPTAVEVKQPAPVTSAPEVKPPVPVQPTPAPVQQTPLTPPAPQAPATPAAAPTFPPIASTPIAPPTPAPPVVAKAPEPMVSTPTPPPVSVPQQPLPGNASKEQKMMGADLNGMKVLVVDDNKMNILIANRFLNKWNVKTAEASNGAMAVEMVDQQSFDLIIMDLQMPVMDGFEATKHIKQKYPHIPVIALTADAMPETYEKASSFGMNDFLTKPFMPEILFEKVSKFYKG